MQLGLLRLSVESVHAGNGSNTGVAETGRLNGHGLAHDGAAARKGLQLGDGAAARGSGRTGGRRHGPEAGSRRLGHEGAHGLGLTEDRVHGGFFVFACLFRKARDERGLRCGLRSQFAFDFFLIFFSVSFKRAQVATTQAVIWLFWAHTSNKVGQGEVE